MYIHAPLPDKSQLKWVAPNAATLIKKDEIKSTSDADQPIQQEFSCELVSAQEAIQISGADSKEEALKEAENEQKSFDESSEASNLAIKSNDE